mmetsp:Transcript_265/g.936  ORF Transcript_265/g.936 Transcript_265/m.936 type:complete len:464 (-) Transcript_265:44-1435(-)
MHNSLSLSLSLLSPSWPCSPRHDGTGAVLASRHPSLLAGRLLSGNGLDVVVGHEADPAVELSLEPVGAEDLDDGDDVSLLEGEVFGSLAGEVVERTSAGELRGRRNPPLLPGAADEAVDGRARQEDAQEAHEEEHCLGGAGAAPGHMHAWVCAIEWAEVSLPLAVHVLGRAAVLLGGRPAHGAAEEAVDAVPELAEHCKHRKDLDGVCEVVPEQSHAVKETENRRKAAVECVKVVIQQLCELSDASDDVLHVHEPARGSAALHNGVAFLVELCVSPLPSHPRSSHPSAVSPTHTSVAAHHSSNVSAVSSVPAVSSVSPSHASVAPSHATVAGAQAAVAAAVAAAVTAAVGPAQAATVSTTVSAVSACAVAAAVAAVAAAVRPPSVSAVAAAVCPGAAVGRASVAAGGQAVAAVAGSRVWAFCAAWLARDRRRCCAPAPAPSCPVLLTRRRSCRRPVLLPGLHR